jgi:hypothetical protein
MGVQVIAKCETVPELAAGIFFLRKGIHFEKH